MAGNATNMQIVSAQPIISQFADDPDMQESIRFFKAELKECIGLIKEAFESGDLQAIRRIAQDLRGAAAGFGFPELTEAASQVLGHSHDELRQEPGLASKIELLAGLADRVIADCASHQL